MEGANHGHHIFTTCTGQTITVDPNHLTLFPADVTGLNLSKNRYAYRNQSESSNKALHMGISLPDKLAWKLIGYERSLLFD